MGGVLVAAALLALFQASPPPSESPGVAPTAATQTGQIPKTPPPIPASPPGAKQTPKTLDKQWIPDPTGLVVGVRWNRLVASSGLLEALEAFSPKAVQVADRLLKHLQLQPEKVEHLIWLAVDGADWATQAVILVAMSEETAIGQLSQRGQPAGFRLGQAEFRRDPSSGWPHPVALVGARWVLSGPEVLLRHLSERPKPQLQSRPVERMMDNWPWDADLAVALDCSWVRSMAGTSFQRLTAVWPETRQPFQILWQLPEGVSTAGYMGQTVRWETGLWCRTVSEAEQVQAAVEELLSAGDSGLSGRVQRLTAEVQAGQWKADQAAQYEKLLKLLHLGVQSARVELAETVVWARTSWKQPWQEVIGAVQSAQEALWLDWREAVCGVIQQQEERLLEAAAAYCKAEGHFPPGAEGGPLWDPATRLSWIALLLPYMGRADWYQQLQLRYPWNSPLNKTVVQRPLEEVLNPAIPQRVTEAGFPVTHYVGVGGLGEDAVQPQADQRRIGVFGFGRTLKPAEITDGLSHTIAIAGVNSGLGPWASGGSATVRPLTQPPYVNGPDGFGTGQPDGMFVGMADGSVRFISKDVDPRVLEMLATARGMERIEGLAWEAGPKLIRPGTAPRQPIPKAPGLKLPVGPGPSETAKLPSKASSGQPTQTKLPSAGSDSMPAESKPPAKDPSEKPPAVAQQPGAEMKQPGMEKETPGPSREQLQAATQARLAEKVASIELPDLPLRKAVSLLEALGGVWITYELEEMEAAGVSLEMPVRFRATDLRVGEILQRILEPLGLVYVVDGEDVLISRTPAARQQWQTLRYEVSDLTSPSETDPEQLAKLLERFVLPESWQASGGRGKIEVHEDLLLVYQTDLGHRRVTELLEKLRLARGLPLRIDPNRKDLSLQTRLSQMRPVLERPMTANFISPTPLSEILAYLEQLAEVPILVDWVSLRAEGLQPTIPATLRAHQQPLAETLTALLERLGLTWRIAGPQLLQITTQKEAALRLEVEFYPVSETISAFGSAKALLEAIKDQVGRGSWEDTQGPGVLYFDPPSKYLIVLQTASVHRQLEQFLANFRPAQPAGK